METVTVGAVYSALGQQSKPYTYGVRWADRTDVYRFADPNEAARDRAVTVEYLKSQGHQVIERVNVS
jgi:hypothetical protein